MYCSRHQDTSDSVICSVEKSDSKESIDSGFTDSSSSITESSSSSSLSSTKSILRQSPRPIEEIKKKVSINAPASPEILQPTRKSIKTGKKMRSRKLTSQSMEPCAPISPVSPRSPVVSSVMDVSSQIRGIIDAARCHLIKQNPGQEDGIQTLFSMDLEHTLASLSTQQEGSICAIKVNKVLDNLSKLKKTQDSLNI